MVSAALVGQVIQSYRLRKGMSQEVLAHGLAGLDRADYSKIERGLRSRHPRYPFQNRTGAGYSAQRYRPAN